ncbi:hypothetical protein [Granulicella aggregans]|uniref:hypothetical protein n=1 Tax=Granulicella aggregans TaxID=474949 RepID=UPI0021E0D9A6|nr:hypothetical protein [Granulicella aggregans]
MSSPLEYGIFEHAVLFTGHMIDAPVRETERFPARAEAAARAALEESVAALLTRQEKVVGIAGGASGGDILFHEVCGAFGFPTLLRLALPVEEYIAASVAPAGNEWVRRFRALLTRLEPGAIAVLDDSVKLPESLTGGAKLNIWQRTNLWMVDETLRLAPRRTLLALWDGKVGDGPGGTEHLVELAPGFGIEVAPIIWTRTFVPPIA